MGAAIPALEGPAIVALASAVKDSQLKAARGELTPGVYQVDVAVRVRGSIEVNSDFEVTPTSHIPIKAALALFVRYSGVTGERAKAFLKQAIEEALKAGKSGEDAIVDACPVLAETLRDLEKYFDTLPKVKRKGAVKSCVSMTAIAPGVPW